jgi:GT2 family glycosyltransferase
VARLDVLQTIGVFDESLGPGSRLYLAEDYDLTYRVLRGGFTVLATPAAVVTHHGFRAWNEARTLMHRSGYGTAAANMKHLRLGDVAMLPTFLHDWVQAISWGKLLRLQRGSGLAYCVWYLRGALASFQAPVDRQTRLYATSATAETVPDLTIRQVTG